MEKGIDAQKNTLNQNVINEKAQVCTDKKSIVIKMEKNEDIGKMGSQVYNDLQKENVKQIIEENSKREKKESVVAPLNQKDD